MMYYAPRILLRSRPMPHPTTCILPAVRRDVWGLRLEAGRARAVLPCCAVCGTVLQHTAERECARVDLRFPYCISLDHCCISVFRYFDVYPRSVASRPHAERRHRPFHWVDRGGGKKGSCRRPITTKYCASYCPVLYESPRTGEHRKNKPASTRKTNTAAQAGYRKRPGAPQGPPSPPQYRHHHRAPPLPTTTLFQSSSVASSAAQRPAREAGWCIYGPVPLATSLLPRAAVPPTTDHRPPPWPRPATRDRT
jgi:hypothetical protein